LVVGLVAGIGGGLVSLGGGTLVIPLLMGWLGLNPFQARGTALAVALFSAAMGAAYYGYHGVVDLQVALWVAIPSLLVTPLAARWSERLPGREIRQAFGLVVIIGGLLLVFRDLLPGLPSLPPGWLLSYLLLVGVLEGLVAGVVGVSGGPVLAPLFVLGLDMPQQLAQGCSLLARLPAIVAGAIENGLAGHILWRMVPWLALGAIGGAWFGGWLALWLPGHSLQLLFGGLLILLGGHYLLRPKRGASHHPPRPSQA